MQAIEDVKCRENGASWSDVAVDETAPGRYRVRSRQQLPRHRAPANAKSITVKVRKRPPKSINPYSQVWSWLRFMNWDGAESEPDVARWLREEFAPRVVGGDRDVRGRFDRNFGTTMNRSFNAFTSLLTAPSSDPRRGTSYIGDTPYRWSNHLCEFAQLVKVTKNAYVQFFAIVGMLRDLRSIEQCVDPPENLMERYERHQRYLWGSFLKAFLPAYAYIRTWTWFLGAALLGRPYGPLLFTNLWFFYVHNGLARKLRSRSMRRDKRQSLLDRYGNEGEAQGDMTAEELVRTDLFAHPDRFRRAIAAIADPPPESAAGEFSWPGPPPSAIDGERVIDWEEARRAMGEPNWWPPRPPRPDRYRQYEFDEESGRHRGGQIGDDPVRALMFPRCARRDPDGAPTARDVRQTFRDVRFEPANVIWPPRRETVPEPAAARAPSLSVGPSDDVGDIIAGVGGGERSQSRPPSPAVELQPPPPPPPPAREPGWIRRMIRGEDVPSQRSPRFVRIAAYKRGERGRLQRVPDIIRG